MESKNNGTTCLEWLLWIALILIMSLISVGGIFGFIFLIIGIAIGIIVLIFYSIISLFKFLNKQ